MTFKVRFISDEQLSLISCRFDDDAGFNRDFCCIAECLAISSNLHLSLRILEIRLVVGEVLEAVVGLPKLVAGFELDDRVHTTNVGDKVRVACMSIPLVPNSSQLTLLEMLEVISNRAINPVGLYIQATDPVLDMTEVGIELVG